MKFLRLDTRNGRDGGRRGKTSNTGPDTTPKPRTPEIVASRRSPFARQQFRSKGLSSNPGRAAHFFQVEPPLGHPALIVSTWQVSWLSGLRPASPSRSGHPEQWPCGAALADDSCGGSSGRGSRRSGFPFHFPSQGHARYASRVFSLIEPTGTAGQKSRSGGRAARRPFKTCGFGPYWRMAPRFAYFGTHALPPKRVGTMSEGKCSVRSEGRQGGSGLGLKAANPTSATIVTDSTGGKASHLGGKGKSWPRSIFLTATRCAKICFRRIRKAGRMEPGGGRNATRAEPGCNPCAVKCEASRKKPANRIKKPGPSGTRPDFPPGSGAGAVG